MRPHDDVFRYLRLLDEMGPRIPNRRRTTEVEDLMWFLRKGAILVEEDWNRDEAVILAKRILNRRGHST